MEGAALAGAGQRDRPRKGGKRTKASKAQELFEEEVKRLVKPIIDVNEAQPEELAQRRGVRRGAQERAFEFGLRNLRWHARRRLRGHRFGEFTGGS